VLPEAGRSIRTSDFSFFLSYACSSNIAIMRKMLWPEIGRSIRFQDSAPPSPSLSILTTTSKNSQSPAPDFWPGTCAID
jgi:hypothetical protein